MPEFSAPPEETARPPENRGLATWSQRSSIVNAAINVLRVLVPASLATALTSFIAKVTAVQLGAVASIVIAGMTIGLLVRANTRLRRQLNRQTSERDVAVRARQLAELEQQNDRHVVEEVPVARRRAGGNAHARTGGRRPETSIAVRDGIAIDVAQVGIVLRARDDGDVTLMLRFFSRLSRPLQYRGFVVSALTVGNQAVAPENARDAEPRTSAVTDMITVDIPLHAKQVRQIRDAAQAEIVERPTNLAAAMTFRVLGSLRFGDGAAGEVADRIITNAILQIQAPAAT